MIVRFLPFTDFICRTERILAQMPLLNKSMWLAAFTSCVIGMCCADLHAQTSPGSSKKSVSGQQTQPRGRATLGPATKTAGVPGAAPARQRQTPADARQPLPQAQPMRIPKLSPEMEDILVEWEQKSAQIKRLEGTFIRITYDKVFAVEQVSEGKYCFKFPDMGSFHQKGSASAEGKKGRLFPQKPGPDERWVCDGIRILKIDDKAGQYEEVSIPEEDRGQNIRNSPLPFLFGMKAIEAKQRYYIELNNEKTTDKVVCLKVTPLMQQDLANYRLAEVRLDRSNFLPTAVKLYDTTGNKEDVYIFNQKGMSINAQNWRQWIVGDPLRPDLRGLKKLIAPVNANAPAGQQLAIPPAAGKRTTSLQPAGSKTLGTKPQIQRTAQLPDDDEAPARATVKKRVQP
ncbi:MAG: hypothetical protein JWN70_1674 [Planctomycetaceae bacterium]|nr:hypothetical protein [Planctomycetaceae bacterium]